MWFPKGLFKWHVGANVLEEEPILSRFPWETWELLCSSKGCISVDQLCVRFFCRDAVSAGSPRPAVCLFGMLYGALGLNSKNKHGISEELQPQCSDSSRRTCKWAADSAVQESLMTRERLACPHTAAALHFQRPQHPGEWEDLRPMTSRNGDLAWESKVTQVIDSWKSSDVNQMSSNGGRSDRAHVLNLNLQPGTNGRNRFHGETKPQFFLQALQTSENPNPNLICWANSRNKCRIITEHETQIFKAHMKGKQTNKSWLCNVPPLRRNYCENLHLLKLHPSSRTTGNERHILCLWRFDICAQVRFCAWTPINKQSFYRFPIPHQVIWHFLHIWQPAAQSGAFLPQAGSSGDERFICQSPLPLLLRHGNDHRKETSRKSR